MVNKFNTNIANNLDKIGGNNVNKYYQYHLILRKLVKLLKYNIAYSPYLSNNEKV